MRPFVRQVDRLAKQLLVSLHVCRVEPFGLHLELLDDVDQRCESRLLLTDMEVRDPRLAGQEPAHVRVAHELRQLLRGLIESPLVRDCDLARADDLIDEEHVLTNGAHHRRWRNVITAGPHARRELLLLEGLHARQQAGDRKSTRLNSSHGYISYAVFCLKKKTNNW